LPERFACRCGCGFNAPDPRLLDVVADLEETYGVVHISSACRCWRHNIAVGGGRNSYHLNGMAADIAVPGMSPDQIMEWLKTKYGTRLGLIEYGTFVHVDTRGCRVPYHKSRS
jgi:uncharacterized protein YcbK (DUF882 family)